MGFHEALVTGPFGRASQGGTISVECAAKDGETQKASSNDMQPGSSLKISKSTVEVDVRNARGEVRRVEVYVTDGLMQDGRGERLQDIFRARPFIPVRYDKRLEFISGQHVSWIRMDLISALDELDPEAEQAVDSVSANVRIELEDGSCVDGGVRYFLPSGRRRVVDYLSSLPAWLPLRTDESLYLINRERIVRVIPLDGI